MTDMDFMLRKILTAVDYWGLLIVSFLIIDEYFIMGLLCLGAAMYCLWAYYKMDKQQKEWLDYD